MAQKGNVLQDCPNASNPYHECTDSCIKRIAQGQTRKEKKKSDDSNGEIKTHSACSKASNPYHECDEFCIKRVAGVEMRRDKKETGSMILDVSRSFGRRKKEGSQPNSPQVNDNAFFRNTVYPSDFSSKKKVEATNGEDFPHSPARAKETHAQEPSYKKGPVQSSHSVPPSGIITSPFLPIDTPKENSTSIFGKTPNNREVDEKPKASLPSFSNPIVDDKVEHGAGSAAGSMTFSFFGIPNGSEGSDEEEIQSVVSDSCVSVGRYHVKESLASILQSIFDKYGDIAANCQLESTSLRSYYLECVCTVVKELQSSSIIHLTKAKLKELLAILKDAESSQIDVSWLRGRINEITEDIELIGQHRSIEAAKANCDRDLESTRKELESQMEDLSLKEKEVDIARKQVAETRARLSEFELKSSQLNETSLSIRSKIENSPGQSLLDELL
ncbi:hypothetical protein I3842_05G081500 [Carya illinoinensis]|uniref:Phospholipase-like protein n=2 Tax=Carya illinoinensis TaxID=32201 RepID=A0A922F0G1_CARIL|nr:hypothetical protein I3842_05G081500 [Carya illinoinensis]KAG6711954.1 hypothetical protein I3842_05G081500 [Carya illinoinensis]KAG6711955.1 hypothetical protein I3842_05G081500 [Carya illinoinensis]KAG6711956.1 hypothetical protein I3842_05G081500 [Carya illinoinensis]